MRHGIHEYKVDVMNSTSIPDLKELFAKKHNAKA